MKYINHIFVAVGVASFLFPVITFAFPNIQFLATEQEKPTNTASVQKVSVQESSTREQLTGLDLFLHNLPAYLEAGCEPEYTYAPITGELCRSILEKPAYK